MEKTKILMELYLKKIIDYYQSYFLLLVQKISKKLLLLTIKVFIYSTNNLSWIGLSFPKIKAP